MVSASAASGEISLPPARAVLTKTLCWRTREKRGGPFVRKTPIEGLKNSKKGPCLRVQTKMFREKRLERMSAKWGIGKKRF